MNLINNVIVGSGISSLIFIRGLSKKYKVLSSKNNQTVKSKNFYEYDFIGGNSNIWGGYINFKRHKKFLKKKNYKKIFDKNFILVKKIFIDESKFSNTQCLFSNKNEIFRVNKTHFKGNLTEQKVKKIIIKDKFIELISEKQSIFTNKLTLCIGNLNLIKLLHKSGLIDSKDLISFDDSNCSYILNFFVNHKKNYYIPMPLVKILEKIFFKKSKNYKIIKESFILQKFSGFVKKHSVLCEDLLKMNDIKIRYFLSNHIANLRINNIPIRKFVKLRSKKINVFCSGTVKKYLPGPIIQDLILDITTNQ